MTAESSRLMPVEDLRLKSAENLRLMSAESGPTLADRLADAIAGIDAPDAVLAVTRHGVRTVLTGGTAPPSPTPRHALRYELGSLSKTFTVLLLVELARIGALALDDPVSAHLPDLTLPHEHSRQITLRHLATHTSGLPRIPVDLIPGALLRPYYDGYADYDTERLLRTFARTRPRSRPGTRWQYSNFGMALLGPAMSHATGASYAALLTEHVLHPLGLADTTVGPGPAATNAIGHRSNGVTATAGADMGAFATAAAIRSTPGDLLSYLEAHLAPQQRPLSGPLREVQVPLLRRGWRHRHIHTLTWFHHPAARGPMLFHTGATFGQQAFIGYHPPTHTGVVGLATRRGHACRVIHTAYELLYTLAGEPTV